MCPVTVKEGKAANLLCIANEPILNCNFQEEGMSSSNSRNISENTNNWDVKYFGTSFEAGHCGMTIKETQSSSLYTCTVVTNSSTHLQGIIKIKLTSKYIYCSTYMSISLTT